MKLKLLLIPIIIIMLSGCANYRELNELDIVTAIGIDYIDNEFSISVQVANPKKQQNTSTGNQPDFVIYEATGKNLQEAFRNIVNTSPNRIYGSHMQVLIISEEIATNHLDKILDFFSRDSEVRGEFAILIARNNEAKDSISIISPLINLSSTNILTMVETNTKSLGISQKITLNDLLDYYLNPYEEMTLPSITIIGDESDGEKEPNVEESDSDTKVKLSTIGIFKESKLLGFLSEEESLGLNFILNNINSTIISHACDEDGYIVFEFVSSETKMSADVTQGKIKIELGGHAVLSEITCSNIDINDVNEVNQLSENLNKEIEALITRTITDIIDKYNTDVFGFQDLFYKTDPNYFKKNYQNWSDALNKIEFDIKADYKLYEKGNTLGGSEYEQQKN